MGGSIKIKMEKLKTHVSKSGSWTVFWILFFVLTPIGALLYWLFKMRKTKTYEYVHNKE